MKLQGCAAVVLIDATSTPQKELGDHIMLQTSLDSARSAQGISNPQKFVQTIANRLDSVLRRNTRTCRSWIALPREKKDKLLTSPSAKLPGIVQPLEASIVSGQIAFGCQEDAPRSSFTAIHKFNTCHPPHHCSLLPENFSHLSIVGPDKRH